MPDKKKHDSRLKLKLLALVLVAGIVLCAFWYEGAFSGKPAPSPPPPSKSNPADAWIETIVTYTDGTQAKYYSYQTASQLRAESILYNGKSVSEVESNFWITPTITLDSGDSITSWSVSGTFEEYMTTSSNTNYRLQDSGVRPLQPLWTFTGQAPQPQLVSGNAVEIASAPLTVSTLQGMYNGWQQGQVYNIYNQFSGSVTINFALAGAETVQVLGYGTGSTNIVGMFQVEYLSSSSFSVTGAFAYS